MTQVAAGVDALLMDGRIVHLRPVSEADKDALTALYGRAYPVIRTPRPLTDLRVSLSQFSRTGSGWGDRQGRMP